MTSQGNSDLHGNAPDDSAQVLLLLDVINDLEFEGGDRLLPQALAMAKAIVELRRRADASNIPVIYANDNFGKWRSDIHGTIRHCLEDGVRGKPVVELLVPRTRDYILLKPMHSAFYATPLSLLLNHLGARSLVIAGMAGDMCVHFTANDAYIRGFGLQVPADCTASIEPAGNKRALETMRDLLKADIRVSTESSIFLEP